MWFPIARRDSQNVSDYPAEPSITTCRGLGRSTGDAVSEQRKYPDMWVDPEDDPRDIGEQAVGEKAVLLDYLRHYRLTLEMKCDGLDAEQLARRSVPPSTLTLLGLVRHMAKVEHSWFQRVMEDQLDLPRLYRTEEDRDLDFNGAVADDAVVADAWASWRREVQHAEAYVDAAPSLDADGQPRRRHDRRARGPGPHDRGVRAALRPRRPAARVHRRSHRPVTGRVTGRGTAPSSLLGCTA